TPPGRLPRRARSHRGNRSAPSGRGSIHRGRPVRSALLLHTGSDLDRTAEARLRVCGRRSRWPRRGCSPRARRSPPKTSFVSANGPSVISSWPSSTRTVVAASAGFIRLFVDEHDVLHRDVSFESVGLGCTTNGPRAGIRPPPPDAPVSLCHHWTLRPIAIRHSVSDPS